MIQPQSLIGQSLSGRYRIDELIGHGGMSAVYKGYDPNLRRIVAIKIIHPHLANDPKFITRFEEEAAAVAGLRHPNIVQVYDFNQDGDRYYMIQEFIPGETLQTHIRQLNRSNTRMPFGDAFSYTLQICRASQYAHKHGLIHRDIKPANIMLNFNQKATLMDFGIVKIIGGQKQTKTGAYVGTALYMPPEMIRGEVPDPRSDIYSLGVTLFEMVTGKPPFNSDSAMTLMKMHLDAPIPDIRSLRSEIPDTLIELINRSMAKERDNRYPSMAEMGTALEGLLINLHPVLEINNLTSRQVGRQPTQSTSSENPAEATEVDITGINGRSPVAAIGSLEQPLSETPDAAIPEKFKISAQTRAVVIPPLVEIESSLPGSFVPQKPTTVKVQKKRINPLIWTAAGLGILTVLIVIFFILYSH